MKYDIKDELNNQYKGFYVWNKPAFFINHDDERFKEFTTFKNKHGFTPDETWSLRTNIALFILPRLKYFKKVTICYPANLKNIKEWHKILDKMIFSFQQALKDEFVIPKKYLKKYKYDNEKASKALNKDIQEGMELFAEYFFKLWW